MTRPNFNTEIMNGDAYYFPPDVSLKIQTRQSIYLLPVYDEFIMGYKNRNAISEFRNKIKPDMKFRFDCMIVSGGQIIGTWKRKLAKNSIGIEYEFFRPTNKNEAKQFKNAITRLAEFTNMDVLY